MKDPQNKLFALVVDDETVARKMLAFALRKEGFICHSATDGEEAMQLIEARDYDLVVADLAMPHKNGHALAVELLSLPIRPTIAIHTAIVEPRITKDLMNRGVDDIVFKPTDYAAFAAKMRILVQRRLSARATDSAKPTRTTRSESETPTGLPASPEHVQSPGSSNGETPQVEESASSPANKSAVLESLTSLGVESLPFSQAALEICRLACDDDSEAKEIAAAIGREPALTAELLRLGNSSHYNRTGSKYLNLEEIVVRVGRRQIGELALALNACSSLRDQVIPYFNVTLAWQRSLAARVAAQILISQRSGNTANSTGILLSAVMHLLGRMVLAKKFPDEMIALMDLAHQSGEALSTLERRTFSSSQSEMLAGLLMTWQIPEDIIGPLRHLESSYAQLVPLDSLHRSDAELVKVAVLVGWIAVGKWEAWDLVEIPPASVFRRLCNTSVSELVDRTRAGLSELMTESGEELVSVRAKSKLRACSYRCLEGQDTDFILQLLPSLGLNADGGVQEGPVASILSCLDATPYRLKQHADLLEQAESLTLGRENQNEVFKSSRTALLLPCTFGDLAKFVDQQKDSENVSDASIGLGR